MSFQQQQDRPPYVIFELRAEEDRTASIEAGHYVAVDVAYALITPPGSRDQVERKATEWLAYLDEQAKQGRFKPEWASAFRNAFAEWEKGNEIPEIGTPIKNWNVLSPAVCKTLLDAGIRTVEDMANANTEAMARVGMGAQDLKNRAILWLASSDQGKVSERMAATEVALQAAQARITELEAQNATLQAQVQRAPEAPARRTP